MKAIIFDMDGVLVDSISHIWDSFSKVLNIGFSEEYIKKNLARSLRDNLKAWKDEHGIEHNVDEFSKITAAIQFESLQKQKPKESLINLLERAKKKGIKLGVGTSSSKWRAEKILDFLSLSSYFEAVVTASDVSNHKPAPDVFLEAAKRLGVSPSDCVVIEDAAHGILAAHSGGMKAIGLVTQYNSGELEEADLLVEDFSEIEI